MLRPAAPEPRLAIVMATYNYGHAIEHALDSAIQQTAPSDTYEVIVVDDGSTDDTQERLRRYVGRIRVVRGEHRGLGAACNAGLAAVTAPRFVRLDADDRLEPDAVAVLLTTAALQPVDTIICFDLLEVLEDGRQVYREIDEKNIYSLESISVLFPTEAVRAVGGYRSLFWEEHDLMLRLRRQCSLRRMPCAIYRYFKHSQSMTSRPDARLSGWRELAERWDRQTLLGWGSHPELLHVLQAETR